MKNLKKICAFFLLVVAAKTMAAPLMYGLEEANLFCSKAVERRGSYVTTKQTVVYHDNDYLILGMADRPESELTFISQHNGVTKTLALKGQIVDFATDEMAVYALTQDHIFKYEKQSLELIQDSTTLDNAPNLSRYSYATGISAFQNQLYISHGTLGLVLRDATSLAQLSHTKLPLEDSRSHRSTLSDIDVKNERILMGVDNITGSSDGSRGMEGYYLLDQKNLEILSFTSIDSRREALDFPQVFLEQDSFFALNWFYLFQYKLTDLFEARAINPTGRFWNRSESGQIIGRISIDPHYVYGCARSKKGEGSFLALPRPLKHF